MTIKWATAAWRTVVVPSLFSHHLYWQRKVALDRALERRSGWANTFLGVVLGCILYLASFPFKRNPVAKATHELNDDATAALVLAGVDPRSELWSVAMYELKQKIASKIFIANDKADIRREQMRLQDLKDAEAARVKDVVGVAQ